MSLWPFSRARETTRACAAVLMFHRIGADDPIAARFFPGNLMPPAEFERILQRVAERYQPMSLPELGERMGRGTVPDGAVALTFDDGYADNVDVALPLLEKYNVPATIYATTGFIDRTVRPLEYELGRHILQSELLEGSACGIDRVWTLDSDETSYECYRAVRGKLKWASAEDRQETLAELGVECGDALAIPFLTWDQLSEAANSTLITVGTHTHTHVALSQASHNEIRHELEQSAHLFERHLGRRPEHFAFPYGAISTKANQEIARAGFRTACVTWSKLISPDHRNLLAIPRITASGSADGVLSRISSILT